MRKLSPDQLEACAELDRTRAAIDGRDELMRRAHDIGVPVNEIARRIGLSRQHAGEVIKSRVETREETWPEFLARSGGQ